MVEKLQAAYPDAAKQKAKVRPPYLHNPLSCVPPLACVGALTCSPPRCAELEATAAALGRG